MEYFSKVAKIELSAFQKKGNMREKPEEPRNMDQWKMQVFSEREVSKTIKLLEKASARGKISDEGAQFLRFLKEIENSTSGYEREQLCSKYGCLELIDYVHPSVLTAKELVRSGNILKAIEVLEEACTEENHGMREENVLNMLKEAEKCESIYEKEIALSGLNDLQLFMDFGTFGKAFEQKIQVFYDGTVSRTIWILEKLSAKEKLNEEGEKFLSFLKEIENTTSGQEKEQLCSKYGCLELIDYVHPSNINAKKLIKQGRMSTAIRILEEACAKNNPGSREKDLLAFLIEVRKNPSEEKHFLFEYDFIKFMNFDNDEEDEPEINSRYDNKNRNK